MTEEKLENVLRMTAERYRNPVEVPLDRMWAVIEARVFDPAAIPFRSPIRWTRPLAYAAVLLVGLGVGFLAGRIGPREDPVQATGFAPRTDQVALRTSTPFVGIANDYLEHATALLIAVAGDLRTSGVIPAGTQTRAQDLLSTTRLLLDTDPADPVLYELLEDLELVLAQVVRLQPAQSAPDAALIRQTLDQSDVLPRLTVLLADARVSQ